MGRALGTGKGERVGRGVKQRQPPPAGTPDGTHLRSVQPQHLGLDALAHHGHPVVGVRHVQPKLPVGRLKSPVERRRPQQRERFNDVPQTHSASGVRPFHPERVRVR